MLTSTQNEKLTNLLNEWYIEIRARHVNNAQLLKEKIDDKINELETVNEDKETANLLLYYYLLDFRYTYLIDNLGLLKESFDKIELFEIPNDNYLTYYYHFFKGIHLNELGNYHSAKEHYDTAETSLKYSADELEKAEFYYKLSTFHYDLQQALVSIKYATKAKDMYSDYSDHQINIAFCDNILGLACMSLREWELAEEHFTSAMDHFQKINEEKFLTMVRHNLGWMYSTQNLSTLAIRYLSDVAEKSPNHYKAIYVKAKEHYKLKENDLASELIEQGLKICNKSQIEGYQHHFEILKALNHNVDAKTLEKTILKGISYFEREQLYEYVQEYHEKLAMKFYEEKLGSEASDYFYLSSKARNKVFEKGALK
ncbi:hypothetical protein BK704_11695 [[Bacillus thuringiensis] serovar konkukian]|nr:hypothetical protein [Bacillus thuringiensis]MED1303813.1 tetratricopeptide repeat protein [Bacillus pacificus]OUB10726.1 hypothetical protein BK704_11695 [[Bacillus thuringiensis] serovar konkukian]